MERHVVKGGMWNGTEYGTTDMKQALAIFYTLKIRIQVMAAKRVPNH